MTLIRALAIIFGSLLAGEGIVDILKIPISGSIIGLLILTLLLQLKLIKESWIKDACNTLIKYMSFFFIPPGVAIGAYLGLIKNDWIPIVTSTTISTILVIIATAITFKLFSKKRSQND